MTTNRVLCLLLMIGAASCTQQKKQQAKEEATARVVEVPVFQADSAYTFVERQVSFGPRIPETTPHRLTGDYIVQTLKRFGAVVKEQPFEATIYNGQKKTFRNIIGSFHLQQGKRVLLAAHWDTRPFADKDEERKNAPFDGANDGASGVGVLLEVARHLQATPPAVGIDIVFFDGEDWGEPIGTTANPLPNERKSWWCLGSQHWSLNKHTPGYAAYYGILLDMVGAEGARFYREGISMQYAPKIVKKVWKRAHTLGYAQYFVRQNQAAITDDHVFVNTQGHIPTIDIVQYQPGLGYFGDYHHTRKDNMSLISTETLQAVGATVMGVIYHE